MWSELGELAYRAARKVMTLDVTVVVWLARAKLRLPGVDDAAFDFHFLSSDELRRLGDDAALGLAPAMAQRVAQGNDFCFAAMHGDNLASYAWFALDSIEAEHNRGAQPHSGVAVSFPTNVAFLYKGFTHPDYRGRKLHGEVIGRALVELAPLGIEAVLSTTDWTNRAARRALAGIGFVELGLCYRWGWSHWMHTQPPREAQSRGAQFDNLAVARPAIAAAASRPSS
jgi:GNAT superfamily N-acetyltransferase